MEDLSKNNDVLGNMYALRAGLSVISQKADELKIVQNREYDAMLKSIDGKRDFRYTISGINDEHYNDDKVFEWVVDKGHNYYSELESIKKKNNCRDAIKNDDDRFKAKKTFVQWLHSKEFEKRFEDYKKSVDSDKKHYNEFKRRYEIHSVFRGIIDFVALIGIIVAVCFLALNIANHSGKIAVIVGCVAGIIGAIIIVCLAHFFIIVESVDLTYKNPNFNALNEFKVFSARVCERDKPIIDKIKNENDVLYMSLQKTFNKTLDSRDWKHLDLIIYYLETGRADTIKEALQLLEREMQTKRIIGAIHEATVCICSAVENMANRISAQLDVISDQLSQVASMQQIQIAQNNELISQTSMQNALIAKSNVTSEQLMKDVQYIKNYGISIR